MANGSGSTSIAGGIISMVFGLTATSGTLGYLVGGSVSSETGVLVSSFLPLMALALGIFGGKQLVAAKKKGEAEGSAPGGHGPRPEVAVGLGIAMAVMAFSFIGLAKFRAHRILDKLQMERIERSSRLAWSQAGADLPPTTEEAMKWLILEDELYELGYTNEQVMQVYLLQSAEWKRAQEASILARVEFTANGGSETGTPSPDALDRIAYDYRPTRIYTIPDAAFDQGQRILTPPENKFLAWDD
ncbi:MAG: hypothetical protein IH945_12605 [Armatimonadetes bacterium]|nr:hypothetical protein [Armatimonadota bacterium]